MDKTTALVILASFFGYQTDFDIFFCYTFTNFWFNTIIYFRSSFTIFFILFILIFFAQVPHTIISFTWRTIETTLFLISITNVVFLIFKWYRCFFFYIGYTILFWPFTWVVWYLNTFFSFDWGVRILPSFVISSNKLFIWWLTWYTCSMSRKKRETSIIFSNIYFFGVSFGTFIRKNGWWNRPWFI